MALQLLATSNYDLHERFKTGQILFGDPLSIYVEKIARHILKSNPSVPQNLQFFCMRSPYVNAVCYAPGVVLVNVGLIAQVNSEAEIAAVLSHEIAHYAAQHSMHSVYDAYEESKDKRSSRNLDYYQSKIDRIYNRDKRQEFEADSLGLIFYSNTGYGSAGMKNMFSVLHKADNCWGNMPVTPEMFQIGSVKLPSSFFKEKVDQFKGYETYNDRYFTHPNVSRRDASFERLKLKMNFKGDLTCQIETAGSFEQLRDLARFEQLRLQLSSGQYGDAIYNSLVLQQKFPENKFLKIAYAKAFYGLARYKNTDEYSKVARGYTHVEGESQQVHYMLKQFNSKQLTAYALKTMTELSKKYPSDKFLDTLTSDLVRDLVVVNELTPEKIEKLGNNELREGDFYINLLTSYLDDREVLKYFASSYHLLEKKRSDDTRAYKEKEKEQMALAKSIRKNGYGIKAKTIIVETPSVQKLNKKGELVVEETEALKSGLANTMRECAQQCDINCTSLIETDQQKHDAAHYNRVALLNECVREFKMHGKLGIRPLCADQLVPLMDHYKTHLVYYTSCSYSKKTGGYRFSSTLYNLQACKIEYNTSFYKNGSPSLKKLKKYTSEDFETVKK